MKKIFVLCLCLFVTPAFAAPVPEYNIEKECKTIASVAGGSAQIELQCRKEEKAAKERVASMNVSASAMRSCRETVEFDGGGNYMLLEQCIKDETAAEKELGN